jgi:hypothetical protein
VAHARDIGRHFDLVRKANASDFTQRRVRLFRRCRVDTRADATPLRAGLQRGTRGFISGRPAPFSDKLIKRRHELTSVSFVRASFLPRDRKRALTHFLTYAAVGEFPKTWRRCTGTYRPSRKRGSVRPAHIPTGALPIGTSGRLPGLLSDFKLSPDHRKGDRSSPANFSNFLSVAHRMPQLSIPEPANGRQSVESEREIFR